MERVEEVVCVWLIEATPDEQRELDAAGWNEGLNWLRLRVALQDQCSTRTTNDILQHEKWIKTQTLTTFTTHQRHR